MLFDRPSCSRGTRVVAAVSMVAVVAVLSAVPAALADEPPPAEVEGTILDDTSGQPVADALVRLVDGDGATRTDAGGRFSLAVPGATRRVEVFVEHPRYESKLFRVRAGTARAPVLELSPRGQFHDEVVVSAKPWVSPAAEVAQAVDVVSADEARTRTGPSLGEAVSRVPGVRNASTGEQAGKPVIRGLTNDRIRVMTNGFAHDHQQFSLRHPPNIEPYHYDRIEVIRGPAALLHGPSAMGGVVNLVEAPAPEARGQAPRLGGEVLLGYASNNDATTGSGALEGAIGGFGYRLHWTTREATETTTPAGELANTGYDQQAHAACLGYTFRGGAHLFAHVNHWENAFGFFLPALPDFTIDLENDIHELGIQLPSRVGRWTMAAHRAVNLRRVFPAGRGGPNPVDLRLDAETYRVELQHEPIGRLQGFARLEARRDDNATRGGLALLPDYEADGWSVALFEELRLARRDGIDRWLISAGLRYDDTGLEVAPTPAPPDRGRITAEGLERDFAAMTGALSVMHRFDARASLAASIGRAWRAPSAYELLARGQHTGVNAFEIGNPDLAEETNLNGELMFRWQVRQLQLTATLFRNDFDHHIYPAFTGETTPDGLDIVEYRQADAVIEGWEVDARWQVLRQLELLVSGEHLVSENASTGRPLPVTPPDRAVAGVRFTGSGRASFVEPFVELRATWNDRGEASGPNELFSRAATDRYTLYDLAAGCGYEFDDVRLELNLAVSNLTDERYVDFLDTYKGYALSPGRNMRTTLRVAF